MKIVIKATNLELNSSLKNLIEEKINSLEKFSKIFQSKDYFNHFFTKGKPKVEAWIEVGKTTFHHKKGPIFWAECQMRFPKKSLRAEAQAETLEQAITEIKDELQRELKEYKEKILALTERRARVLKKDLKISPLARLNFKKNFGGLARFYPPASEFGRRRSRAGRKGRIREEGM